MLLADAQAYASLVGTVRTALLLALIGVLCSALILIYADYSKRSRWLLAGSAALFLVSGAGLYASFSVYLELADDGQAVYKTQRLGAIERSSNGGEVLEIGSTRYTLVMPSRAQEGEQAHLLSFVNGQKRLCVEGTCFALQRTEPKQTRAELTEF